MPELYSAEVGQQILDNYQEAEIPEVHKELFHWAELFTQRSWDMSAQHLQRLHTYGLTDANIVGWAQAACLQTWFTMGAEGGGVPLDSDAGMQPVFQKPREFYTQAPEGLTAAEPKRPNFHAPDSAEAVAWVATDGDSEEYQQAAAWAEARYGFVPNLLQALSLQPEFFRRHTLALELLERPQTESLSPRQHAMVRALVSTLTRCQYSADTTRRLVASACAEPGLYERLTEDYRQREWAPLDRVILDFATKVARNAYKVTEDDAQRFHEVGLDDEAYVDVLNTVAIQTSFDRLANSLGVRPDPRPLLPRV